MRRAPSGAARAVRLEVARGGDVVYGEDYGAASPAVLGRAEEAFGDSHLVSYLPGVAGCLARRVAWAMVAVVAIAPATSMRSVACSHTFVKILDGDGPGGPRRLLALGRV